MFQTQFNDLLTGLLPFPKEIIEYVINYFANKKYVSGEWKNVREEHQPSGHCNIRNPFRGWGIVYEEDFLVTNPQFENTYFY